MFLVRVDHQSCKTLKCQARSRPAVSKQIQACPERKTIRRNSRPASAGTIGSAPTAPLPNSSTADWLPRANGNKPTAGEGRVRPHCTRFAVLPSSNARLQTDYYLARLALTEDHLGSARRCSAATSSERAAPAGTHSRERHLYFSCRSASSSLRLIPRSRSKSSTSRSAGSKASPAFVKTAASDSNDGAGAAHPTSFARRA